MTQTPALTGQDIGQAENAVRAVLERLLARTGTAFHSWVIINLLGTGGQTLAEEDLVGRMVHGLKIADAAGRAAIAAAAGEGLVGRAPDGQISLTQAGAARSRQVREGIGQITQRLYSGLPAGDLATAHRVLATVTERANAVLADPAGLMLA